MKDFKFLTKNNKTLYDGEMSREAIQYLNDYSNRVTRYEMTTMIATYKVADVVYGDGNVVAGTVNAYPLDASNIRVTYNIRGGEITSYTIDIDYWNTVGQMINALTNENI